MMVSMGFEFDTIETTFVNGTTINQMQCYATVNYERVKELPFKLTVSETRGRVVGSLIYEVDVTSIAHWIEEENEDDFFNHAHMHVENWIFDRNTLWDENNDMP